MASAVASKGAMLPSFPKKLLTEPSAPGAPVAFCALRTAAVTPARRPNSTQGKEPRWYDDNGDDSSDSEGEDADTGDRRRARDFVVPSFPSQDVVDPVGIPTCLTRLYSLMEDAAAPTGLLSTAEASWRGWWVEKDDDVAVYLKVPMLGLGKEHVKVWAEQNILVIKGEGEKGPRNSDYRSAMPSYSHHIDMPVGAYKMDKIKAEMKGGVLKVTVPKVKEEECKDVFHVKIE